MSVSACCLCRLFWHAIISLWTHSAKHAGAAIVKCAAWRVQCECEAIVQCECAVIVKCATCGEWSVQHVESEVWSVKCAAWRVQCECECGAWGTHFEITEFTVSVSVAHEARTSVSVSVAHEACTYSECECGAWGTHFEITEFTVSVSVEHEARTSVSVSVAHEARTYSECECGAWGTHFEITELTDKAISQNVRLLGCLWINEACTSKQVGCKRLCDIPFSPCLV